MGVYVDGKSSTFHPFSLKKGFELTSYTFTDDRAFYPTPKNSVNLILYRKRISPLCIR